MTRKQSLAEFIADAAVRLGVSPSTVGGRAGQGGRFYDRLIAGARVWPETDAKVRARISQMLEGVK